jgi:large subunit ribosomal protein L10
MKREKKIATVNELKEKFSRAKSFVLADYRGLTHLQMEEIKKGLKPNQAEFLVTKNTLLKIALGREDIAPYLAGPTAALFSYGEEISPLSLVGKFIKTFGLPKIKVGVIGEKVLSSEEILQLAALPSREILLATLLARLKSPLNGLNYSLAWNLQKLVLVLKRIEEKQRPS